MTNRREGQGVSPELLPPHALAFQHKASDMAKSKHHHVAESSATVDESGTVAYPEPVLTVWKVVPWGYAERFFAAATADDAVAQYAASVKLAKFDRPPMVEAWPPAQGG